ncbi:MAG: histidine kinase dimerization/phospho-acceptor domain-containing protein [Longimicrobiales bacterium]
MNAPGSAIPQWQIDASRFAVLSRMADDLAHEIKNPLNSMVINLEVLRSKVEKGAPGPALERAAVLEHEIRRLNGLVEVLLRLLRPTRDRDSVTSIMQALDELQSVVELRARLAHVPFARGGLTADAFTAVPADTLRFSLLLIAELVLEYARSSGTGIWLTATQQPGEIEVRIGCDGGAILPAALSEDNDSLRGIPAAAALLGSAGGRVEVENAGGPRPAVLIRVPRSQFL